MRVLVLGSGVIGTASAYYLARAGFEVVVVDRQDGPALETSFANAGQVSPGYASPWAAPGIPLKAMKWLLEKHAPLAIKLTSDPSQYAWMLQMLRNCTAERYAVNKERMVRLSEYSRDCLDELRAETGIAYEGRTLGTTQLFRTQAQLDAAGKDIAVLERSGVPYEVLDRDGIARVEPALAKVADKLVGALRLPNDQTGDCQLFTTRLAEMAKGLGVEFRFGQNIERLDFAGDRINGVLVNGELLTADHYVLALGSYSPQLLAAGYQGSGLSAEGLLADRADHQPGDGADLDHPRRDLQGGDHPLRPAHPRRRHGGNRRLRPVAEPAPPRDPGNDHHRPLSRGRRHQPGDLLDRPAPGDPGWHPDRRRHPLPQPVPQYRPRHPGLDHGLRVGSLPGRPDGEEAPADQHRRPGYFPLQQFPGERQECPSSASTLTSV